MERMKPVKHFTLKAVLITIQPMLGVFMVSDSVPSLGKEICKALSFGAAALLAYLLKTSEPNEPKNFD